MGPAFGAAAALLGPIGGTLGKIALAAGAFALQFFLAPRPEKPKPNNLRTTKKSEEGPGRWAIGRVELEGQVLYGRTSGYNLYRVIMHCFGPIDGIEEYWYDGFPIVVEADAIVSSPPYARIGDRSWLRINTKLGTGSEVAWSDLVNTFGGYTTDHRIRGIAQTKLRLINPGTQNSKFGKVAQGGLKAVRIRARASLFDHPWDPRLNSGAGARAWTINGPLIAAHIRTLLPGTAFADMDWDDIGARATEADATVSTLEGTAPRSVLSGGGEGALTVDVMLDFLRSAGLEEVRAPDGKVRLAWLEDYPDAELHLQARHVLARTVQRGPEGVRRPNVCRVKYLSPERGYVSAELPIQTFGGPGGTYTGPAWARVQDEADRYGEQEMTIELPYCPDKSQAQRIARRLFHMERADTAEVITTFAGLAAWSARTIDIDLPDVGAGGGVLTVRARVEGVTVDDAAGQCRLDLRIIPDILQTAWNPAQDEVGPPPDQDEPEYDAELETPAAPTDAVDVGYPDGTRQVRIAYSGVPDADVSEANYRTYTGGLPDLWAGMTEVGLTLAYLDNTDLRGERVDFRVRMFDADENPSFLSPLLEVPSLQTDATPPAAPTATKEVDDPAGRIDIIATAPTDISVVEVSLFILPNSIEWARVQVLPGEEVRFDDVLYPAPDLSKTYRVIAWATGSVEGGSVELVHENPDSASGEP